MTVKGLLESNMEEVIKGFPGVSYSQRQNILFVLCNHPRFENARSTEIKELFEKYGVSIFEEMYTNALIYSRACAGVEELRVSLTLAEERKKELYNYYVGNV